MELQKAHRKLWTGILALFVVAAGGMGCGQGLPTVFPLEGHVQLGDSDTQTLAGHTVEVALESDPTTRAFATIGQNGEFALESLLGGVLRRGALPGRYRGRIVISDDDADQRAKAARAIPKSVLKFETSDLFVEVPSTSKVVWKIPQS